MGHVSSPSVTALAKRSVTPKGNALTCVPRDVTSGCLSIIISRDRDAHTLSLLSHRHGYDTPMVYVSSLSVTARAKRSVSYYKERFDLCDQDVTSGCFRVLFSRDRGRTHPLPPKSWARLRYVFRIWIEFFSYLRDEEVYYFRERIDLGAPACDFRLSSSGSKEY